VRTAESPLHRATRTRSTPFDNTSIESAEKLSVATIENRDLSDQIETDTRLLSSKMLAQLDGVWVNQNQSTPSITHFRIERRDSDVFVHAWGACHPTDCDWGEQRALVDQDSALVLWDQGFVFRKMVIRLNKRTDLTADDLSIFTDNSGRAKYEKVEVFSYKQDSNSAIAGSSTSSPTSPPVGTAGRVIR
jgi:hypothetical protein